MALYDNQHWLLSHIRDSFLSTDDTGKCEMVMLGEDIPRQLKLNGALLCYPGIEESDDEDLDALAESYDIKMDIELSHRQRSNTARRLEEMDLERKKAAKINVKWEQNSGSMSVAERAALFQRKDFRRQPAGTRKRYSLLSEQLEKCPNLPQNPFMAYAKFDGNAQVDLPIRKYGIFMCMLPKDKQMYPLQVAVIAAAKVYEFIGLICYKYASEHLDHPLKEDVSQYGLYLTEEDGEVDWDLPCLNSQDIISKYDFPTFGLVEIKPVPTYNPVIMCSRMLDDNNRDSRQEECQQREKVADDLAKMEGHTTAMEAPLYQSYRVYVINKMRAKTEIYLGISGEKIEINPVATGKGAGRFWNRQRAVSYQIDNIAWCEVTEMKESKTMFTLVYTSHSSSENAALFSSGQSSSHTLHQSASFKNHEFEADTLVADEIVRKINHILELHSSTSRKDYISQKEKKATRRRSFHLHR